MPHTRPNITQARELYRPARVAQRIVNRESYGTPVTDRFYPERTRDNWPDVMVPVEEITQNTLPVPLVLRGAPGLSVAGDSGQISAIFPQPFKTVDGISATAWRNRQLLAGREGLQADADRLMDRHIDIHRKSRESLAAQSLRGRVDYPIAGATGQIVDVFSVKYGDVHVWQPSVDWMAEATTPGVIRKDLSNLRTERARRGYATTGIDIGRDLFASIYDKLSALGNDSRVQANVDEPGTIVLGGFRLMEMAEQVYHPGIADFGQPGGAVAAGYKDVLGPTELMATDENAPWRLLNVALDNFLLPDNPAPVGFILDMARDGSQIDVFAESKPFFVPPAPAISIGDATDPA